MTFADALNLDFNLKCDMQMMEGRQIELSMMTDSLRQFDAFIKLTMSLEKWVIFEFRTIKDSYQKLELNVVTSIRSEFILAHPLTK